MIANPTAGAYVVAAVAAGRIIATPEERTAARRQLADWLVGAAPSPVGRAVLLGWAQDVADLRAREALDTP